MLTPGTRLPAANRERQRHSQIPGRAAPGGRPDQPLRWITGAYFERDSQFYPQNLVSPGFDSTFGAEIGDPTFNSQTAYGTPAPDTPFYGTINLVERQFALFGEATYSILPQLDLTLGARYFDFKDDFNLFFTGVAGAIAPGNPDMGSGEQSSKGVNPRGCIDSIRITDQVMIFGEAARGFRYGGVNEPAPVTFCESASRGHRAQGFARVVWAGPSVELYARRKRHVRRRPAGDERRWFLHRSGTTCRPFTI